MKLMSVRWTCVFLLALGVAATSSVTGFDGRWKLGDDGSCYFDATDSGPDQCVAPGTPTGRWKAGAEGACYWDPADSGPDQCVPPATEPADQQ